MSTDLDYSSTPNKKEDQDNDMVVSVIMITYLHAKYIAEAINGVLIQECNFPIELIIADDNSPDETEEVIKEYLKNHPRRHLVKYTKHSKNKGMHANGHWAVANSTGKYIAICEGDDYWTDPYKLQKQVDFLEDNPDYGLIYTKARIYEEKAKKFWKMNFGSKTDSKGILYKNPIPTLTTLYRRDLSVNYDEENNEKIKEWAMGDYPRSIWFYFNSKVHFINEVTAVYRRLEDSASNSSDVKKKMNFAHNTTKIQLFFANKYLKKSEYLKLKNSLVNNFYYKALIFDSTDSIFYYKKITNDAEITAFTKIRLFVLEKLKLKYIYLAWFNMKRFTKEFFKRLGIDVNG